MFFSRVLLFLLVAFIIVQSSAQQILVQSGDSLWIIAQRFETTVEALQAANQLKDTELIAGMSLIVPTDQVSEPMAFDASQEIVVQPGDNLWLIARRHDTTVEALQAANQLKDTELIAGMSLIVPTDEVSEPMAFDASQEIVVQPGDNLWLIARRHDTTVEALQAANQLSSDDLMPGMALAVPLTEVDEVAVAPEVVVEEAAIEVEAIAAAIETESTAEIEGTAAAVIGSGAEIVVQPGDSLWAIAQRYDTSVEALQLANSTVGHDLMPGMTLVLPTGSVTKPETYTVQEGDTLYDIAVAFKLSVDDLIAFNQLDGTLLSVGQELVLSSDSPPANLSVVVKQGDSLWSLAREYESNVYDLREANNITDSSLMPGQTIVIPGRYANSSSADVGGPAPEVITVAKGDSLWKLARAYNTSVQVLMSANGLSSTEVQAGQELKIVTSPDIIRAGAAPMPAALVPSPSLGTTPVASSVSAADVMMWPLRGAITSRFGYRQYPAGVHYGLDIDGETGDPIVAARAGKVTFSGWRGSYGNLVVIEAGNSEYRYAHASELLVDVGDYVSAGQTIARVGTTGKVTGSHLHFEILVNGEAVDPQVILEAQAR
jgi:LysM repeat protein